MPLVNEQYPNLINGVSQQSATMRLPSQASEQVNGYSSISEGLHKRPPTEHVKKVSETPLGSAHVHMVNRDASERYNIVVSDENIRVFDLDGEEQAVSAPAGFGYLSSPSPRDDFKAVTLADSTFIVNKGTEVQKSASTTPARDNRRFVYIKGTNYGVQYTLKLNGTIVAAELTPQADSGVADKTDKIAEFLYRCLTDPAIYDFDPGWPPQKDPRPVDTTPPPAGRYDISLVGNMIILDQLEGNFDDDVWEITDSFNNTYSVLVGSRMNRITELPTTAPNGFQVEITGEDTSEADTYFLTFRTRDGGDTGPGHWEETVGWSTENSIDPATMPHELKRLADGSFEFAPAVWGERIAGDVETAPWPSFVGEKISDMYFDRNRLCIVSGSNVIMSRARALFEFFPTTVTTILDDGPIDVRTSGSRVSVLRSAVSFNEQVILFGDQTQYTITAETLRASEPPSVDVLTDYETDGKTVPVAVGKTLYFTVSRKSSTAVMEYFVVPESDYTDASDVTRHVPTYIPKGAFKVAASTTSDILFLLTDEAPNSVFVYKYYWRGSEKVQSSWSRWDLPEGARVLNVGFVKDDAFLLVDYADGAYMEKVTVSAGQMLTADNYLLDRRVSHQECTVVYDADADRTTVTLPYTPTDPDRLSAVALSTATHAVPEGADLPFVSVSGRDVQFVGEITDGFYIGENYTMRYVFSEPVLRTGATGGGTATITGGRLQIHKWFVTYAGTGYFRAEVKTKGRPSYSYDFSGKILGSTILGDPSLTDGTFSFRVNSKSTEVEIALVNDSYMPSYFTAAEWEGRFERRTGR